MCIESDGHVWKEGSLDRWMDGWVPVCLEGHKREGWGHGQTLACWRWRRDRFYSGP